MKHEGIQESDSRRLSFLLDRYSQLTELDANKNRIIHTTFYLSVVFFGIMLGGFSSISSFPIRAVLYVYAAAIFVSMLLWTRTYITSRNEIHKQKVRIVQELLTFEFNFESVDSSRAFFADENYQEGWEANGRKEILLQLYYALLAYLSLGMFVVELLYQLFPHLT